MDIDLECEALLKILSSNLASWMKTYNLSNRALARISMLSESTIRAIKKGQKNIEIESLVKLRLSLSVTTYDLLTETKIIPKITLTALTNSIIQKETSVELQKVGKRISKIMEANGIKPEELSIIAYNTDYSDTLKYLKGEINITLFTVLKFTAGLKVSEWLLLKDN